MSYRGIVANLSERASENYTRTANMRNTDFCIFSGCAHRPNPAGSASLAQLFNPLPTGDFPHQYTPRPTIRLLFLFRFSKGNRPGSTYRNVVSSPIPMKRFARRISHTERISINLPRFEILNSLPSYHMGDTKAHGLFILHCVRNGPSSSRCPPKYLPSFVGRISQLNLRTAHSNAEGSRRKERRRRRGRRTDAPRSH